MPFVTPSMAVNVSGQELGYELYMRPLYGRALIDVIKHYNWLKVYYIYESEEGKRIFFVLFKEDFPR